MWRICAGRLSPGSVWWWWASKFIFPHVSLCAVCVEVGCFSAITYSFVLCPFWLCVEVAHFLWLFFCLSVSLSFYPPLRLVSDLMIYNMTPDLSLPPCYPFIPILSACRSVSPCGDYMLHGQTCVNIRRWGGVGGVQVMCSGYFLCSVGGMGAEIGMGMV